MTTLYELERSGDAQEIIRHLRESDNDRIRARAAELLGNFDEHADRRDVVGALVDAARDENDDVSAAAVDSLEELGGDAIEQLIGEMAGVDLGDGADWAKAKAYTQALTAEQPELRMAAANGLGGLGQGDAVDSLVNRFDDPDPRVRARAARACGQIGDPRATGPLETLLRDDAAPVRREAAEALGYIGSREALQALLPMYEDDHAQVRRVAVDAFGNFENDRPVEYLVASLTDEDGTVRRTAVYSLVQLLANVPTEKSHDIRDTVVETLSETDDPNVVIPLVEILEESTQPAQRRNTAWLLGRVTDEEARGRVVDALVEALGAEEQMLRQFAATSLTELGGEDVEKRLLDVATDGDRDPDVRGQAIFALGKVGGERSRAALDDLIESTDEEVVREKAFSAISKLGGRG